VEALQPLRDVCREADEWVASIPSDQQQRIPCKRGCAWCCYQFLETTVPEAMLMVLDLVNQRTDPEKFKQWCRVVERRAYREMSVCNKVSTREDAWKELSGLPCVFLRKDKSCLVYESRPVMCRTYFVMEGALVCERKQGKKTIGKSIQLDNLRIFERSQLVAQRVAETLTIRGDIFPMAMAVRWALFGVLDGHDGMRGQMEKEVSER
jgi:Fe-S-cluster containining protein